MFKTQDIQHQDRIVLLRNHAYFSVKRSPVLSPRQHNLAKFMLAPAYVIGVKPELSRKLQVSVAPTAPEIIYANYANEIDLREPAEAPKYVWYRLGSESELRQVLNQIAAAV